METEFLLQRSEANILFGAGAMGIWRSARADAVDLRSGGSVFRYVDLVASRVNGFCIHKTVRKNEAR